jgi:2,5-diketo-D-gluconate reductase A
MIPSIELNTGATIPQLGFGTLIVPPERDQTPQNTAKTAAIVGMAIEVGYRHIDTAQMYGNEAGVGEAVTGSGIDRAELFVTSKLGNGNHRPEDVRRSFDETLDKLGGDYLDLFLMHWPLPMLYDGDYVSTWAAMTELAGPRLRNVGVSNFQPEHLRRIIDATGITPVVNQVEAHPYFGNTAVMAACAEHHIAVEAWSPLGQGTVLQDPVIAQIAAAHDRSSAQIVLRWHVQHGHIIIPKSIHRERMQQNIGLFDFALTADDMAAVDALDRGPDGRIGPHPDAFDWIPATA